MHNGWHRGEFRDCIAEITSGKSVNSVDEPATNGSCGVLKTSCVYNGHFDPRENKRVIEEEKELVKCPTRKGSIIVSRMNTASLVGASGLIDDDYPNLFLPDRLWLVTPNSRVDAKWFALVIGSPEIRRRLSDAASGTSASMKNISQEAFLGLPVAIPPLAEQRKIAMILQTWDDAIDRAEHSRERRERLYLGLRNKLIDWSSGGRAALSTFLKPVSRPIPKPSKQYRALSIRSHGKGTFPRVVEKPDDVDMDTLYVAKAGDIIVNITFAWEGAIALVAPEHDGGLVSHRFPTFVPIPDKANARYLRHALRMPRFTYFLGIVSPGGAGRNRVLNKGDFLDLEVPLPSLNEQARIAGILDDAERAIAAESKFKDALTRQKRGLMQKLLTGEWQVKVDSSKEAAA
jgi:type I restriction enzyme S subunit